MPQTFTPGAIQRPDIEHDDQYSQNHDANISSQLFVFKDTGKLPQKQQIVAAEVHTEQEHENGGHVLNIGCAGGHGIIINTKAACTGSAESGTDRLQNRHFAAQQKDKVDDRQCNVNHIKNNGGLTHFRY